MIPKAVHAYLCVRVCMCVYDLCKWLLLCKYKSLSWEYTSKWNFWVVCTNQLQYKMPNCFPKWLYYIWFPPALCNNSCRTIFSLTLVIARQATILQTIIKGFSFHFPEDMILHFSSYIYLYLCPFFHYLFCLCIRKCLYIFFTPISCWLYVLKIFSPCL